MTLYIVEPERGSLHGAFSRDLPPILEIEPGDTVRFRTLDAGWQLERRRSTVEQERPTSSSHAMATATPTTPSAARSLFAAPSRA